MSFMDLALSFFAGSAAGAAYLGALWLSVRAVTRGGLSPAWLLVSAVVRLAFLLGALFWIMGGQISRLFAALVGFTLIRLAATWPGRRVEQRASRPRAASDREAGDAVDAG
jgi:F1F0 ATPase subunit 2